MRLDTIRNPGIFIASLAALFMVLAIACAATAPDATPPPATSVPGTQNGTAPTAVPEPTSPPDTGPVLSDQKLVVAVLVPAVETNDPNLLNRTPTLVTHFYEYPVQVNRHDGTYDPMLATGWEMAPDGKSWTLELREGVRWHDEQYGEFSAADLVHSLERITRDDATTTNAGYWRRTLEGVDVINDHEVIVHLSDVELDLPHMVSSFWDLVMLSKAQFDAVGQQSFASNPVATGPYKFQRRSLGEGVTFERVSYEHWRVQPEFKELEFRFVREPISRQGLLLTGQVHIAEDIPIDIRGQAIAQGMQAVRTTIPSGGLQGLFGGNYFPDKPQYNADAPLANKLVRQALNIAINRDEIVEHLFDGKYDKIIAPYAYPAHEEYKAEWEDLFEELYAYNPQRARELLTEAGYPNGFDLTFRLQAQPGAPGQDEAGETVAGYWQNIGVNVTIEPVDFVLNRTSYMEQRMGGIAWVQQTVFRPPWNRIQVFNIRDSVVHSYESEYIEERWTQIRQTTDIAEHQRLTQEIIEHMMTEYAHFPLVWVFPEFMINPNVVSEFVTTGISGPSDVEYARVAR